MACCCGTLGVAGCSSSSRFHWEWLLLGESSRSTSLPQPTLAPRWVLLWHLVPACVCAGWLPGCLPSSLWQARELQRGRARLLCPLPVLVREPPASPLSSDTSAGVGGSLGPWQAPSDSEAFWLAVQPHRMEPISGESEGRHLWPPLYPSEEVPGAAVCASQLWPRLVGLIPNLRLAQGIVRLSAGQFWLGRKTWWPCFKTDPT